MREPICGVRSWVVVVAAAAGLWALPAVAAEGVLDVTANASGASVRVDGTLLGAVPLVEVLPEGRHTVRVEHPSFSPFEQTVDMKEDTTVEIRASLVRIRPALSISADVPEATIYLDGKVVGTGTAVVDPVSLGGHSLRVEGGAEGRYEGRIKVRDERVTPVYVKLKATLGKLTIRSVPSGAHVALDGEEVGMTPLRIPALPPGSYSVRLSLEEHSDSFHTVAVSSGREVSLDATLVTEAGELDIRPKPEDAIVSLNGVEIGRGRFVMGGIKPGRYSMKVRAPGHADSIQTIQIEPEEATRIAVRLSSFDSHRRGMVDEGGAFDIPRPPPIQPLAAPGELPPIMKKPWFWVAVGGGTAVVVAIIAGGATAAAQDAPDDPATPAGTPAPTATHTVALP